MKTKKKEISENAEKQSLTLQTKVRAEKRKNKANKTDKGKGITKILK